MRRMVKVMKRLTESNPNWYEDELWPSACEPSDELVDEVYRRLKFYEDLANNNGLMIFPYPIGTAVYNSNTGVCKVEAYLVQPDGPKVFISGPKITDPSDCMIPLQTFASDYINYEFKECIDNLRSTITSNVLKEDEEDDMPFDFSNRELVIKKLNELKSINIPKMTLDYAVKLCRISQSSVNDASQEEIDAANNYFSKFCQYGYNDNKDIFSNEECYFYWGLRHGDMITDDNGMGRTYYHYVELGGVRRKIELLLQLHPDEYEIEDEK